MEKLIGRLSDAASLRGRLSDVASLRGMLTIPSSTHMEYYQGPYEVTPRAFNSVVLPTNDKTMTDDVTVFEIPYWETSNLFDGKTVYIANEV